MFNRTYVALASLFVWFAMSSVSAHDAAPTFDRINYRVSASQEVENDTLVAVMYYERSGQQPTAMADDVNRTIGQAVDTAKKQSAIKVQTLNYRQEPMYKNERVTGWRVRQSIRLESTDVAALGALIGELQARLSVASLSYTVSPGARSRIEDAAPGPVRMRAVAVMAESGRVAPPTLEAGVQMVTVQVSGTIELEVSR